MKQRVEATSTASRDLAEAREQLAAANEILRVISASRDDPQPVFDLLAQRARKLCGADLAVVSRFDGETIELAAVDGLVPDAIEVVRRHFPQKPDQATVTARAVRNADVVHVVDVTCDESYAGKDPAPAAHYRAALGVPVMQDGKVIGTIFVGRTTPGLFMPAQIELLRTFAQQAAIAIENARQFHRITRSLRQQTATTDVLRAIGRSAFDLGTVLHTLVESAVRLCEADRGTITRQKDGVFYRAESYGFSDDFMRAVQDVPIVPDRGSGTGRALLEGRVVHIPDVTADPDYTFDEARRMGEFRTLIAMPMMRENVAAGVIALTRDVVQPFTGEQIALLSTFADQAAIAIENSRLFTELEARNRELSETLEQQTATSEILRVISRSPTDVQPVFDTIAAAAQRLCGAESALVVMLDGNTMHLVSCANASAETERRLRLRYPRPRGRATATGRAIESRGVVAIMDTMVDPEYDRANATPQFRSALGVPLLQEGVPIGAIGLGRAEPGPFTDRQIALLSTFADQAIIAIENVRLFREIEARNRDLSEALEQQTATSEILRVISTSRTGVGPVFETIAESALRLCDASSSAVMMLEDGLLHIRALSSTTPDGADAIRAIFPRPPSRDTGATRAVLTRELVEIPDVTADPHFATQSVSLAGGFRGVLAVPLLRDGQPVGVITLGRPAPGFFSASQVDLLRTFADQALIAIENVRLFTELEARNRDLSEALEQQTATSEILRAMSRSQTDAFPVFQTIAHNAHRLSGAARCNVLRYDGKLLHIAACHGFSPEEEAELRARYPVEPSDASVVSGRVLQSGSVEHYEDVTRDPLYDQAHAANLGLRRMLGVPMLREGAVLGVIVLAWHEPGETPSPLIDLLRTFADQAVIAIENVRLFTELEARTAQLTRSVSELRALGDVGQAVSSTLDLETVLSTIVTRAIDLSGVDGGAIYEYDEAAAAFHLHTSDRLPPDLVDALRANPIRKGEGVLGRMAITAAPVEIVDLLDASRYQSRVRNVLARHGFRSIVAVPLMRDNQLLGGLAVNRKMAGAFDPRVIELLKTFAAQSAIAIQNARLFREIESKGRALETASRHKSEFLANMSHELRTPLNAIIGFSEVLAERLFGPLNDKQAEYVGDIADSGRHLLSLINDILDLSKIEAGRMELDAADFDLQKAVLQTAALVRERAERRGIALATRFDGDLSAIHGDERKVKQVLLNLLSNALKFTPEGGSVAIRATRFADRAEIAVADTGVGIAPEDRDAVFEEFRQVGASAARVEGTGLGLAISRKFIELHGGRIWLDSELGKGSTFTFSLPAR